VPEPIEGWLAVIEDDFRAGRGCSDADGLTLVAEVLRQRDRLREKNEIIRAFAGPDGMTPEGVAQALERLARLETAGQGVLAAVGGVTDQVAGSRGLIARMLPLVSHGDRCPMAFHRSDGEQCTCGALDVVAQARALLAGEGSNG